MNFLKYLKEELLNEKISKKELEIALNNNKIIVGAEFEFKCDELVNYTQNSESYDEAIIDYRRFRVEWDEKIDDQERINGEINDLERQNDEISDELRDVSDRLESIDDEKEIIQRQIDDVRFKDKLSELKQELIDREKEKSELSPKEDKLIKKLQKIEQELSNFNDELEEGNLVYPGRNYFNYMEQSEGCDQEYIESRIFDWEGDIPEPSEMPNELEDQDTWLEIAENILPDILEYAPFEEYEIGEYDAVDQGIGNDTWAVEYDKSISPGGGVEIKSPPLPLDEFLDVCPKMFKWMSKNGFTDKDCGFHIHMSIKGITDLRGKMDFIKLMLFTEEEMIFSFFDERRYNSYCVPVRDNKLKGRDSVLNDIKEVVNSDKLYKWGISHFDAINFQNIKQGHIEFRYMGATNYEKKWDDVRRIIGSYSYVMSIAMDDNYKRKEYILKSSRILNKKLEAIWYYAIQKYVIGYYGNRMQKEPIVKQKYKLIDKIIRQYRKNYCPNGKILPWDGQWANAAMTYGDIIIKDVNKKLNFEEK